MKGILVELRFNEDPSPWLSGRFATVSGLAGRDRVQTVTGLAHRLTLHDGTTDRMLWEKASLSRRPGSRVAELSILADDGSVLGRYRCRVESVSSREKDNGLVDVDLIGDILAGALPGVERLWARWRRGRPPVGAWRPLDFAQRMAWLEIARHRHWRCHLPRALEVTLDGSEIVDYPSFFCALGEALFGAGGYAGADLDGLADALVTALSEAPDLQVRWVGAAVSRSHLDAQAFDEAVDYRQQARASWDPVQEDAEVESSVAEQAHESLFWAIVAVFSDLDLALKLDE